MIIEASVAKKLAGRLLGAAHRKRVGHRALHHADPWLGQIGLHAQPLDDAVQLGLLFGGDFLDAHRGHREFVRGEQLHQQQHDGDDHDQAGSRPGGEQHADEHHVDEAEQEHGQQHAGLQASVLAEARSLRCHRRGLSQKRVGVP
jgi:hypothetical protein